MKLISDGSVLYSFSMEPRFVHKDMDSYLVWTLVPVAIYDYVNRDYSDKQGWLQEIPHTGTLDYEEIVQYVCVESFEDALEEFGYEFIDVGTVYVLGEGREAAEPETAETAVSNAFDLW
jgi:hypothetical protein